MTSLSRSVMIRLWFGQPFYMILFVTRDDVALSILNDSVMVRASLYLILFVTYYIAFPMYGCQLWFRCLLIVDIICVVWRRHHDPCLPNSAVLVFSELDCCIRIIDAFFFLQLRCHMVFDCRLCVAVLTHHRSLQCDNAWHR